MYKLHIWKLFTHFFFFGRLGFPFLMTMFMLYQYSLALENHSYVDRLGDCATMVLVGTLALDVIGWLMGSPGMANSLFMMIVYLWSQRCPDQYVSFYFGIRFKASYLPWALLAFGVLLGQSPMADLYGILIGHTFFFLHDLYPEKGGVQWFQTPALFKHYFGQREFNRNAGFQQPAQPNNARPAGHAWGGGGYRLGRE